MVTSETLEIFDLETETEDACRPERVLPSATYKSTNVDDKRSQTGRKVHLTQQVELDAVEPSARNALAINDCDVMPRSNNSVKAEETEQKKVYEKCLQLFRFLGLLHGIRLSYAWKPQRYFLFYYSFLNVSFTGFSIVYTVHKHCVNGNYVKALEPLAVVGVQISCALKLNGFRTNWQEMLALIFSIRKYLRPNFFGRQAEILTYDLKKIWVLMCMNTAGYIFAISIFGTMPIVMYLTTKEFVPLIPVEIIFCDQSQTSGFIGATFVQSLMGSYACLSSIMYSATFSFCISNYILQVDLIAADFQELDRMWSDGNDVSIAYKHAFLKNVCKKRQDINHCLNTIKKVYETKLFIYFCSSYFAQIISLFDITVHHYYGACGHTFGLFMEMMFYCYLGTQISIADDRLRLAIYNSNWYAYDLKSQQMLHLILHESQQPNELILGPIGPLNLTTGISIIKSIYSYYTVLTEVL